MPLMSLDDQELAMLPEDQSITQLVPLLYEALKQVGLVEDLNDVPEGMYDEQLRLLINAVPLD